MHCAAVTRITLNNWGDQVGWASPWPELTQFADGAQWKKTCKLLWTTACHVTANIFTAICLRHSSLVSLCMSRQLHAQVQILQNTSRQKQVGWLRFQPSLCCSGSVISCRGDTEVSGWLCNCVALEIERIPLIPHALFWYMYLPNDSWTLCHNCLYLHCSLSSFFPPQHY